MIEGTSAMDRPVARPGTARRRALLAAGIGVAAIAALALLVPTLRRWSAAEATVEAARVQIGVVTRGDLVRDVLAQGRVVAARHPTLFSPAAGIVALATKAGEPVRRGQLLARVESPELVSRLAQERATLMALRSAADRQKLATRQDALRNRKTVELLTVKRDAAVRELARAQRTFDEGILDRGAFEKAKDDLTLARMELDNAAGEEKLAAEAAAFETRDRELQVQRQASVVSELERQVDGLALKAPFDGMVASVAVQDRDAVASNQGIVTVVSLNDLEVELSLAENEAPDVLPGTRALVLVDGRETEARVTAVSPAVQDGVVKGTVAFAGEPPAGLKQSQRVSVRIVLDARKDVLKLPRGPFLQAGGGRLAYVVTDGTARVRPIEVGAVSIGEVEVVKGLAAGDRVIVSDTSEFGGAKTVLLRK